jgi:glycosyltransferase involved in cell wall biosynthesis
VRILNVTQTYFPFLEFGGPPVKVRSLSRQLVKRGHHVTVLRADWGLKSRASAAAVGGSAERSAHGWRVEESGIEAIYPPNWPHYRALSWNPGVGRFCGTRLRNVDVVHIFGLYDFLGPAVAAACRHNSLPEPIGMFVPIVRSFLLKRLYHLAVGQKMLRNSGRIIATSPQAVAELTASGLPTENIQQRRNGVEMQKRCRSEANFAPRLASRERPKSSFTLGGDPKRRVRMFCCEHLRLSLRLERDAETRLLFVGPDEGGMKARLQKLSGERGLLERVEIRGGAYGQQKWSAYKDADVFVLPSQNENFESTAAEAVAVGTAVVVTEKCAIAPLLADVAGLVVAHDAAAIAQALYRVWWART